ncbi:tRNA (adenosine(37)-N6)-threonylcarbamoyltransferase complex transferase subunit TsaD [Candidatus Woesearchaeota archaeon]|nr:tRNA (adenosine(37)-N6)-threonylcarbamoyltransferase complex transferase subunit TsaD [Candidatus Woesearchaeota archaeon]
MITLGIESTAHTFGIGMVTDRGKILANVKDSYSSLNAGMIPDQVAEHHQLVKGEILKQALREAKIDLTDVDYLAYSSGPGIDPCLWVGYNFAKELSEKIKKPLIAVNHCAAHLSIGKLYNQLKDPVYLYVSGVNTQIIIEKTADRKSHYVVLGETLDIGLGNMLDKLGRIMGLGFPAGPGIEELAKGGKYLELPYVVKGMDASFSGILTKAQQLYERKQATKEDLCFSVQETCFAMITEVAERALAHTGKTELVLIGGVGANQRFCEMLQIMCKERKAEFYNVPIGLAGDQGAMIAWEGFLRKGQYGDGQYDDRQYGEGGVKPHWRVDEV